MSRSISPHAPSDAAGRALRDVVGAVLRRWTRGPCARRYVMYYERVLGTSLELQVVATRVGAARRAEAAVLAEVDRLAELLSGYAPTSELARWQMTRDVAVPVSAELAEVLEASEAWRIWTGGAFHPAAASLVALLRDSESADGAPTEGTRDDAQRQRAVHDHLLELHQPLWAVDRERGLACRLTRLPVSLDAIAKGYIVDRAAARARAVNGVVEVLLNVGGDLQHHGKRALAVGVADPRAPAENAPPVAAVQLRGEALATSGGYRRGFPMGGRRVSHIVDPRTGRPADRVLSASVLAPDCATADALSTAFCVLAPAESVALADALPGVGCLLVGADGTVTTNVHWRARAIPCRDAYANPHADAPATSAPATSAPAAGAPAAGTRTDGPLADVHHHSLDAA